MDISLQTATELDTDQSQLDQYRSNVDAIKVKDDMEESFSEQESARMFGQANENEISLIEVKHDQTYDQIDEVVEQICKPVKPVVVKLKQSGSQSALKIKPSQIKISDAKRRINVIPKR